MSPIMAGDLCGTATLCRHNWTYPLGLADSVSIHGPAVGYRSHYLKLLRGLLGEECSIDWNLQELDRTLIKVAPDERDEIRRGIRRDVVACKGTVLVDIQL